MKKIDTNLLAICAKCLADYAGKALPTPAPASTPAEEAVALRKNLKQHALCCVSGQDLAVHVARRSCPAAKFPVGEIPPGWTPADDDEPCCAPPPK
jgi:hypothetical protein